MGGGRGSIFPPVVYHSYLCLSLRVISILMTAPIDIRIDPSNSKRNGSKARDEGGKKCSAPTAFCWFEVDADAISNEAACSMLAAALRPAREAPK